MYKKMLIPLDGSEAAESLFPYAKEIAGRLGLEVIFLYVCNQRESESLFVYQAYVDHMAEIVLKQAKEIREKAGIQTQEKSIEAQGRVLVGHPAEEILRYSDEKEVDLILMATHGRTGIKRWTLGSVADKVCRTSTVPVWLVRAAALEETPDDEGRIRKIVVSLDGSELSESVLPYVETLVKQWGTELVEVVLLMVPETMVISPIPSMEMPISWGNVAEEQLEYLKKASGEYLAKLGARLSDNGINVSTEVIEGVPAEEIIKYANEQTGSLIAMATHGRSGLGRWAYGSVAEKVISGASRPVFLVRPPSDDSLSLFQTFVGTARSLPPVI